MAFGNATKGYVRTHSGGGGGGGTSNYNNLSNKPQINGVELTGNKTSGELNIGSGISFIDKITDISTGISMTDINNGILLTSTDSSGRRISGIYTKADILNNVEYVFGYSNEYCNSKLLVSNNTLTIQHVSGNNLSHVYVF